MKYINTKDLELEASHYLLCEKESEAITLEELKEITNRLPSADVVEVKHGEWIDYDDDYGSLMCSICEKDAPNDIPWDFCPYCGADMRQGDNDV